MAPAACFDEASLPAVTVQLPMFNESRVAERLIRATAAIDYPANRLEIQVLDDSTDDTKTIARAVCAELRSRGVDISYLHREDRTGYKAGALERGLRTAKGELIVVFDADFVPGESIVRDLVHYFTDPAVGMVQARWSHLNRGLSALTECQAMLLDGHFVIEHAARHRSGCYFNFNGTAGIWRRAAIEDAGGWEHDTITEDMDLSYRAQLRGWQFIYLPEVSAPAELPADMTSFKSQQYRWAKGSVQTGRKLLPRIMRAPIPWRAKQEAFFHLTNNFAYPFLLLLALLQLPNMVIRRELENPALLMLDVPLFVATCGSVAAFYVTAYADLYGSRWPAIRRLPLMMALGVGLAVNNARASIEGLFGNDVEFVRTPKSGVVDGTRVKPVASDTRWPWHNLLELGFGLYTTVTLTVAVATQSWASLPFVSLFCAGFLYVGVRSLLEVVRSRSKKGTVQRMSDISIDSGSTQLPSTHSSPKPQSILS